MNGSNDQVEGGKNTVRIIEHAICKDITFNAFENFKGAQLLIEFINIIMLLFNPLFGQSLCIERRFTVIADHEVLEMHIDAGKRHFFNGIHAVAPVAVRMDDASDISRLNQMG